MASAVNEPREDVINAFGQEQERLDLETLLSRTRLYKYGGETVFLSFRLNKWHKRNLTTLDWPVLLNLLHEYIYHDKAAIEFLERTTDAAARRSLNFMLKHEEQSLANLINDASKQANYNPMLWRNILRSYKSDLDCNSKTAWHITDEYIKAELVKWIEYDETKETSHPMLRDVHSPRPTFFMANAASQFGEHNSDASGQEQGDLETLLSRTRLYKYGEETVSLNFRLNKWHNKNLKNLDWPVLLDLLQAYIKHDEVAIEFLERTTDERSRHTLEFMIEQKEQAIANLVSEAHKQIGYSPSLWRLVLRSYKFELKSNSKSEWHIPDEFIQTELERWIDLNKTNRATTRDERIVSTGSEHVIPTGSFTCKPQSETRSDLNSSEQGMRVFQPLAPAAHIPDIQSQPDTRWTSPIVAPGPSPNKQNPIAEEESQGSITGNTMEASRELNFKGASLGSSISEASRRLNSWMPSYAATSPDSYREASSPRVYSAAKSAVMAVSAAEADDTMHESATDEVTDRIEDSPAPIPRLARAALEVPHWDFYRHVYDPQRPPVESPVTTFRRPVRVHADLSAKRRKFNDGSVLETAHLVEDSQPIHQSTIGEARDLDSRGSPKTELDLADAASITSDGLGSTLSNSKLSFSPSPRLSSDNARPLSDKLSSPQPSNGPEIVENAAARSSPRLGYVPATSSESALPQPAQTPPSSPFRAPQSSSGSRFEPDSRVEPGEVTRPTTAETESEAVDSDPEPSKTKEHLDAQSTIEKLRRLQHIRDGDDVRLEFLKGYFNTHPQARTGERASGERRHGVMKWTKDDWKLLQKSLSFDGLYYDMLNSEIELEVVSHIRAKDCLKLRRFPMQDIRLRALVLIRLELFKRENPQDVSDELRFIYSEIRKMIFTEEN